MFIGKTLAEVAEETRPTFFCHYFVRILQDEEDDTGEYLDVDYSIKEIIKKYPEVANYKVKSENEFFGGMVLRIIKDVINE